MAKITGKYEVLYIINPTLGETDGVFHTIELEGPTEIVKVYEIEN